MAKKSEQSVSGGRKWKDGSVVEWMSSYTTKVGKVVGVIPKGDSAKKVIADLGIECSKSQFKGSNDDSIAGDRYLVEVKAKPSGKPVYYTPLVKVADGSSSSAFRKPAKTPKT